MKLNLSNLSVGKNRTFLTYLLVATGIIANASAVKAFDINLNYLGSDPAAEAGFEEAAAIWESKLSDSITVNLDVDFKSLGGSTLGQNSSEIVGFTYSSVETALINDVNPTSSDDTTATSNLPGIGTTGAFTFVGTEEDGSLETIDGDNGSGGITASSDNLGLAVTRANAKALGLLSATDTAKDAEITFSSDFAFDLDRSDGINSGEFDFVGVALHEIGHALGFSSGVDVVDGTVGDTTTPGTDLDPFTVFNVLDLYRHSDLSVAISEDAGIPVLDLSVSSKVNGNIDTVLFNGIEYDAEPYLSIDGGINELNTDGVEGLFSTGRELGDGQQASHFKDDLGIGLLDPTIAAGVQGDLTASDLRAFDVIGYDLADTASVPFEFSPGLGLFLVGGVCGATKLKKRRSNINLKK